MISNYATVDEKYKDKVEAYDTPAQHYLRKLISNQFAKFYIRNIKTGWKVMLLQLNFIHRI